MPPEVAHVPIAITASARGASRQTHSSAAMGPPAAVAEPREVSLAGQSLVEQRALYDEEEAVVVAPRRRFEGGEVQSSALEAEDGVDELDARYVGELTAQVFDRR